MPTIEQTITLISQLHAGQMYGDLPFHEHPIAVCKALPAGADEDVLHAALLHDVLEDTPTSEADLLTLGYSERTVQLVAALSRLDRSISYMDWVRGIAESGDLWLIRIKRVDNMLNLLGRPEMIGRYGRSIGVLARAEADLLKDK